MKWVLIMWLYTSNGGVALDHVEFWDKAECEAALQAAQDAKSWVNTMQGVCVERSLPKVFGP
jgi:hypothetical protein